jgi:hypothetical protein
MMIDRPAFNYDNSGNPIVPAEASVEHNALVKAIESSDGPPHLWTLPRLKKNISGLPDWDKPRNEQGQFLSKSDADLRATWQREGGADQAIAKVRAVEAKIMAASPDAAALQSHITAVRHSIDSR